jgi:hypothetical protein
LTQSRQERKVAQRMPPYMLDEYATLFQVKFEEIDGCVYVVKPGQTKPQTSPGAYNKAQAETEHNKQWFHYDIGDTQLER